MAELRIQPKKSAPSPWLLVALAVVVLAAAAYFFLRPDTADEPAPAPAVTSVPTPTDSLAPGSPAADARATPPPSDSLETSPPLGSDSPARVRLLELAPQLTQLADRTDLRDDATIREQRDNFTSAISRLEDNDPAASLRPGLVAAANLLLAVQQKGYPNLEAEANALTLQASELSGRDATPAEQTCNRAYLAQVASLLNTLSYPIKDVL
ncbi:hypothetical protein [Hymenobacter sp. BT559]|uniref:hypothetical protein n=1 Tax=Hymenobacter sp. BT559 TaxID=2795729 RepID=UPI0018EBEC3A|nr:hypothetical protein [Hymenobacter sp. BT559]MBJ6143613.1 hypothetical protein [Hymenobacter sp. BT559]